MDGPQTVAYKRVSDITQADDEKTGFARQQEQIENYAKENNLTIDQSVEEIFTGMESDRPALRKILDEAIPGTIILVESMDRFTRDIMKGLPLLMEIIAADMDIIDTSTGTSMKKELNGTPWQRFLTKFKMLVSQFEREQTRHRLQKGREKKAQERGYYKAGPSPTYTQEFREGLREMRKEGMSYRKIAEYLNEKGEKTATGVGWSPPLVAAVMDGGKK